MQTKGFRRTERMLHQDLLEAHARFHNGQGGATELTAALKRFNELILGLTILKESDEVDGPEQTGHEESMDAGEAAEWGV
jgi:hypothetical protein